MTRAIEITHLSKSFGDVQAVRDISFQVREGELFAFLGVNGAGKSTTISILCGTLPKDSGMVLVNGKNIDTETEAIARELGVVFQNSVLDRQLTVRDNLFSRAALYGLRRDAATARIQELASLFAFEHLLGRTVGKLSGGERRRIDVARALLHKPRILVLDEPTTGLDPGTRKILWEAIDRLRREDGMTVLLTTHYMEETADADYVVILDAGCIVAEGTPLDLKNAYTGDFVTLYGVEESEITALGLPYAPVRDGYRIAVADTTAARELICTHSELFHDFEVTKGKMDDVFLAVTGKRAEGGAS